MRLARGREWGQDGCTPMARKTGTRASCSALRTLILKRLGLYSIHSATNKMREFLFQSEIWLPKPPEVVFPFFSEAANLERLTPSLLQFEILTPPPISMKVGTLIDYRLRVHGIPLKWQTRITVWEPPFHFADEQLRGPYRQWIHEHRFLEENGGTRCVDAVRYAVWGGALVNALFIERDVAQIFAYRNARLKEIFG